MKKSQEAFYNYLETFLKEMIDELKPEVKQKAFFTSTRNGELNAGAKCYTILQPPKIEVFINSLDLAYRPKIEASFKFLLAHEIIHAFQGQIKVDDLERAEKEAYIKQSVLNFWK